ncbi:MAG: hypothetical protein UY19_C0008G0060 [Candidatus Wolfebacteria bacterium GW2011_GWA2_47_9b]|uniref:Uncharacterized protein n=1 Tax=Candidatus Wolfebacteria bacterium GW2011_GWA2_47_9b TaxID=1619005 RepID=A0A0G1U716_9BACT|nr:MAG: hypothetical protein UY19_C0008G0060 [Candidatus Wolfebacteria bacterium GW2011_GWA2_47_9b]
MIEKLIEKLIELFSVKGHKNTAIKAGIFLLVIFDLIDYLILQLRLRRDQYCARR